MNTESQQFEAWHSLVADPSGSRWQWQIQSDNLPTPKAVARRARQLWEDYNRPNDRDDEIWAEAERQLIAVAENNNLRP